MNKLANARRDVTFVMKFYSGNRQTSPSPRAVFRKNLSLESWTLFRLRQSKYFQPQFRCFTKHLSLCCETFVEAVSSIQAQLFTALLKAGFRKNPAVAAAGS